MVLLVAALVTYTTLKVLMVLVALGVLVMLVVDSDQLLQTLVLLLVNWVVAVAG